MQPYLESLPDHTDGAPPWTPTNRVHGITSRPLKHDPEIALRDLKDLRIDHRSNMFIQSRKNYHAYMYLPYINPYGQSLSRSNSIHTNSCFILHSWIYHSNSSRYQATLIPTSSLRSHAKFMPNPSFPIHESYHSCIFICLKHLTQ